MRGISWLAENRLASQDGLYSMECGVWGIKFRADFENALINASFDGVWNLRVSLYHQAVFFVEKTNDRNVV